MFNGELITTDVDAVTDIVRMLDKKKDARPKDLLTRCCKNKGQRQQRCSGCGQSRNEASVEEGN